jgi:group I intron endonuclease
MLRSGKHDNSYLQHSWNKYGEDAFTFELVEQCAEQDLITKEKELIMRLASNDRKSGFNIGDCVVSPMKGRHHSASTKKKISVKNSGALNPRYGIKIPLHMKKQISKSLKAYKSANPQTVSEATKRKISASQSGSKNHMYGKRGDLHPRSKQIAKVDLRNGSILAIYGSMTQASLANNVSQGNLSTVLAGRGKSLGGYGWKYYAQN